MDRRLELHEILVDILGTRNVYFQPPSNLQMQYPAIVYKREDIATSFAGNNPYRLTRRYRVTVIDRDPDSPLVDKVAHLPGCRYSANFVADGLHHDNFRLYF